MPTETHQSQDDLRTLLVAILKAQKKLNASIALKNRPRRFGYTTQDLADLFRISPDRVRTWIRSGELGAINTAKLGCGKPRFVILPRHVRAFVAARRAAQPPNPKRSTSKKPPGYVDYYPD